GCKMTLVGASFTLTATGGALTNATSSSFAITPDVSAKLKVTGSGTQTAGAAQNITVTALDAYGNTATGYTGDHTITFSGATTIGANNPTVTSKTAVATNFGTGETLTFTNGVSTAVAGSNAMKLYKD